MVTSSNAINIVATFNGKQAFAGLDKLEKSFGRFKKVVMTVLAGKMVKQASEFGKQMSLMSDRVGMSVAKLTALKGAFTSAGAGAKGFERTINNISNGLLGISRGNGAFAAKLGMMGISPYGMDGQLKKPDDVLYDIADWAKGQKDSGMMSEQDIMYYLMSELGFDEATAKMAMGGSGAIRAESERAKQEGRSLDDASSKKLMALSIKMSEMWETLSISLDKVIVAAEPVLTWLMDAFQSLFKTMGDYPVVTACIAGFVALMTTMNALAGTIGALKAGIPLLASGFKTLFLGLKAGLWGLAGVASYYVGKKSGEWLAGLGRNKKLDPFLDEDGKLDVNKYMAYLKEHPEEYQKPEKLFEEQPANLEQASNTVNGGTNIEDNTKIEIVVQGNMDSETYERLKEEFPPDKYIYAKEDM